MSSESLNEGPKSTGNSINLRKLEYSPHINPLVEPQEITSKRRYVKSGRSEELLNPATGEVSGIAAIHQIEEKDDAEFVKVFAAGVSATYDLSKTAHKVFQVVLEQYQKTPMSRGFTDYVNLFWFDGGIDGSQVGMSEKTFQRGLKELIEKKFLYPKDSASFWINPTLFFKGDRVMFIREYRRKVSSLPSKPKAVSGVDVSDSVVNEMSAQMDEK